MATEPETVDAASPDGAEPAGGEVAGGEVAGNAADAGTCPDCGAGVAPGERYCEACGSPQPGADTAVPDTAVPDTGVPDTGVPGTDGPAAGGGEERPSCTACGGQIAEDGYCESCGARAVRPRDHFGEQPSSWVAGVCDRGLRHRGNEDAMAVAAGPEPGGRAVLVVCDGVTSSENSDVASLAAARAARDVLTGDAPAEHDGGPAPDDVEAGAEGAGPVEASGRGGEAAPAPAALDGEGPPTAEVATEPSDGASRTASWIRAAGRAASDAVVRAGEELIAAGAVQGRNPPSCTLAVAVVEGRCLVAGWVGDSRVYWIPDAGRPLLLTTDDSWAAERIAAGVPRAEAESGPRAHAITRWLGVDSPDPVPRVSWAQPDGAGWVMACTDGLWNYCSEPEAMADLVRRLAAGGSGEPPALAEALVAWANQQGGHDNITVTLARVDATSATAEA